MKTIIICLVLALICCSLTAQNNIKRNDIFTGSNKMENKKNLEDIFSKASIALEKKDFTHARSQYSNVLSMPNIPMQYKSYAQIRIAQTYEMENNLKSAKLEYKKISENSDYPEVHRYEAKECIKEIERTLKGLPKRDIKATRTKIEPIKINVEYFVSPKGNDNNDGSKNKPFATIQKAQEEVRKLKKSTINGGIAITLKNGIYNITDTISLNKADSGTKNTPIIYRGENRGKVTLYGGKQIKGFTLVTNKEILDRLPETARGKVYECNLKAQGITDYSEIKPRGFSYPVPNETLELFFNDEPQTLSRYPNKGFLDIKSLVASGNITKGEPSIIEYEGNEPERWTKAKDMWIFGYFKYLWADGTVKVSSIDTTNKTLIMKKAYKYGGDQGMDTTQGIIYYAFNLLEEIDEPGEWYLDRETGILYFYPPSDPNKAVIEINMFSHPMLTMDNVSNVRIENISFDLGRNNAITMVDSSNCLINSCTIKRFAGDAVRIIGGENNGIYGSDIYKIGRTAIELAGGDRITLTPCNHFVENCKIYNFGRVDRTYTPAILINGVGIKIRHNLMYDCPSSAMRIEGNDHIIEYNEFFNTLQESDDQGAIDLFYNPTYRGNIFRYNYFHDNGKLERGKHVAGQAGIRFDDAISGMLVYSNIFVNSSSGNFGSIQINSGRDNIIDNNIIIDSRYGASGSWYPLNSAWVEIRENRARGDFYINDFYKQHYPAINWMMDDNGDNHFWRNIFYNCEKMFNEYYEQREPVENKIFTKNPGFVSPEKGNFNIKPNSNLLNEIGFKPIPFNEIGIYNDDYRVSKKEKLTPKQVPDWHNDK